MRIVLMFIAVFVLCAPAVQAQDYGRMFEAISELNVGNPSRDPRFDTLEDVMDRRVQDKKHKVVGNVESILVNDRGDIEAIQIDFNRLRLSTPVSLNYSSSGIQGLANSYVMRLYEDQQIEELFPTFLANTETAAGGEDVLDAQNIVGSIVKSENGQVLGQVDTLLFDNSGDRVRALYIDMKSGNFRGVRIAIPFDSGRYDINERYKDIILSQQQSQALLDYVESN